MFKTTVYRVILPGVVIGLFFALIALCLVCVYNNFQKESVDELEKLGQVLDRHPALVEYQRALNCKI